MIKEVQLFFLPYDLIDALGALRKIGNDCTVSRQSEPSPASWKVVWFSVYFSKHMVTHAKKEILICSGVAPSNRNGSGTLVRFVDLRLKTSVEVSHCHFCVVFCSQKYSEQHETLHEASSVIAFSIVNLLLRILYLTVRHCLQFELTF